MYSQLAINTAQKNTMTTMKLHLYDNRTDIALTWYPFSPGGPCGPCSPCHTPYSKQTRRVTYGKQKTNKQQTNNKQTNKQTGSRHASSKWSLCNDCLYVSYHCSFWSWKALSSWFTLSSLAQRERKRDSDYLMHLDSSD